jgi:competence protein ComEA
MTTGGSDNRSVSSLPVLVLVLVLVLLAILVPRRPTHAATKALQGAVNLNTAPPEVLGLLPGIGPAKAQSIVAYRKKHPFRTVDELVRIKGVGRRMVRGLRPHLAVGGPTTAVAVASAPGVAPPPPPPPPLVRRPAVLVCARVPGRPARPARPRTLMPTHGACPPLP